MKKFILILTAVMFIFTSCTSSVEKPSETENATTTIEDSFVSSDIISENEETSAPMTDEISLPKNELLRTGEFYTAEQMETLKTQALSWQSTITGIGGFAVIVAIEPLDGSNQQVFISVDRNAEFLDGNIYEKIQIQTPDRAQTRIISAGSGGGSGEVQIGYKFVTEDSEWIELFYAYAGDLGNNAAGQWENETEFQYDYVEMLNKLSPDERQFK